MFLSYHNYEKDIPKYPIEYIELFIFIPLLNIVGFIVEYFVEYEYSTLFSTMNSTMDTLDHPLSGVLVILIMGWFVIWSHTVED